MGIERFYNNEKEFYETQKDWWQSLPIEDRIATRQGRIDKMQQRVWDLLNELKLLTGVPDTKWKYLACHKEIGKQNRFIIEEQRAIIRYQQMIINGEVQPINPHLSYNKA